MENTFLLSEAITDLSNVIKNDGKIKVDRLIITKNEIKVVINGELYDVNGYKIDS